MELAGQRVSFVLKGAFGSGLVTGAVLATIFFAGALTAGTPSGRLEPLAILWVGFFFGMLTLPLCLLGTLACVLLIRRGVPTRGRGWLALGAGAGLLFGALIAAPLMAAVIPGRTAWVPLAAIGSASGAASGLFLAVLGRRDAHLWRVRAAPRLPAR